MEHPMIQQGKHDDTKPEVEDGPRKKILLAIWTNFGDSTTMHGLGRAVNSKMMWKRFIWSLLVICGACVAGRNLYLTLVSYFHYPVTTTVELQSHRMMTFPAVTICNLNPARMHVLDSRIQWALENSVKRGDTPEKQEQIYRMKFNKYMFANDTINMTMPYYNISDMIVDCRFDLMPCSADDFVIRDNFKYGLCYTFNGDTVEPMTIGRSGNSNGLILELDIQQDDYLPFVSTSGIKVLVHPQSDMAFPEDGGVVVGPGKATSLGTRKMALIRQPRPWGKCLDAEGVKDEKINMFGKNSNYTMAVCQKTCYQRSVFEYCGCCDVNYPCNKEALMKITGIKLMDDEYIPFCDESIRKTFNMLKRVRQMYFSGELECMDKCKPACKEVVYLTSYATGSWPQPNFKANLATKAKRSMKTKQKSFTTYPDPLTDHFVSNNFLRLEVFFESFVEEVIRTNPAYDWNTLLSDIGGQLGLWLGFSIMTAIEILELIYDFISFIFRRASKTQKGEQRSDNSI